MRHRRSTVYVSLAANRCGPRFAAPTYRAFCRFQTTNVPTPPAAPTILDQVRRSPMKIVSGDDQWDPLSVVSDNGRYTAVTSRAFGLERAAYRDIAEGQLLLKTGDRVFDRQTEGGSEYPHLETQRVRLSDLFLTDSLGEQLLDMYQLQP